MRGLAGRGGGVGFAGESRAGDAGSCAAGVAAKEAARCFRCRSSAIHGGRALPSSLHVDRTLLGVSTLLLLPASQEVVGGASNSARPRAACRRRGSPFILVAVVVQ